MSNPAVTKLCMTRIAGLPMWMDDNIGEAIHIHYGDFRLDLTNNELGRLCEELCEIINAYFNVELDFSKINPIYFEVMLRKNISHLTKVTLDSVRLKDMLCPSNGIYVKLPESKCVKALHGDSSDNDGPRASHHIGQSSQERLDAVYESITRNGYPYNGEYIIMYGDDNIIQDGQHRAACLWEIMGDISVPVMRFSFDNYVSPPIEKQNKIRSLFGMKTRGYLVLLRNPKKLLLRGRRKLRKSIRHSMKQMLRKLYLLGNKEICQRYVDIVGNR